MAAWIGERGVGEQGEEGDRGSESGGVECSRVAGVSGPVVPESPRSSSTEPHPMITDSARPLAPPVGPSLRRTPPVPGFGHRSRGRAVPWRVLLFWLLALPGDAAAQEPLPGPWVSAAVGAGFRLDDPGQILVDRFGIAGHLRAGYTLGGGTALGVEWGRIRLDSSVGALKRETLAVVFLRPRGPDGDTHLKLGLGLGRATRVEIEEPAPGGAGDRVVTIGDEGGLGATAGISFRVPVRNWAQLNPGVDLHVQRLDGLTVTSLVTSMGLVVGRHRPLR